MKFYSFREDEKKVDIFNERFYRHPETGKFYRNVTTILGIISKGYNYDEWLKNNGHNAEIIVDRAGKFGTEFHKLVELLNHYFHLFVLTFHFLEKYTLYYYYIYIFYVLLKLKKLYLVQ